VLAVKLGIDPYSTIHLGHSIPVRKLRAFQDAGHTAVLIIGDFTAQLAILTNPRCVVSRKQRYPNNTKNYLKSTSYLIFDTPGKVRSDLQLRWLSNPKFGKRSYYHDDRGQMLARGLRNATRDKSYLLEFLYPLMHRL